METKEYEQFSNEWRKEMKKWNKDDLISFLKGALIENLELQFKLAGLLNEEKILIYFHNHFSCYADTGNKAVIPAFTKSDVLKFVKWLKQHLMESNQKI